MQPPEPCIKGRCWSPTACNDWGYCRERNEGRCPSIAEQNELRAEATERRIKAESR